ncbi:hypothetical protein ElyMa_001654400 [Elysia marginata]|uniref:Uncharacterized protein n=1 Tax=Elysia marginata TaxID=1093978 RepID=A0AAV4JT00_9GAST|nr:hypothetical protein ElyMa_001654400 [Elysia marginata]
MADASPERGQGERHKRSFQRQESGDDSNGSDETGRRGAGAYIIITIIIIIMIISRYQAVDCQERAGQTKTNILIHPLHMQFSSSVTGSVQVWDIY